MLRSSIFYRYPFEMGGSTLLDLFVKVPGEAAAFLLLDLACLTLRPPMDIAPTSNEPRLAISLLSSDVLLSATTLYLFCDISTSLVRYFWMLPRS